MKKLTLLGKTMKKGDWALLRLLMIAYPNTKTFEEKIECSRCTKYLYDKYGSRVVTEAIQALWHERTRSIK